jgi:putative transposase
VSQTHSDLLVHIVFSTKNRESVIKSEMQEDLNAYLAGIVRDIDGYPILFKGVPDHVHGLISLRPKHSIAKVVQEVKAGSSRWIHEHWKMKSFAWQSGYGAFSVSRSQGEGVADYIRNQQEHHRKIDFKQECTFCWHGGEYDERYVWS